MYIQWSSLALFLTLWAPTWSCCRYIWEKRFSKLKFDTKAAIKLIVSKWNLNNFMLSNYIVFSLCSFWGLLIFDRSVLQKKRENDSALRLYSVSVVENTALTTLVQIWLKPEEVPVLLNCQMKPEVSITRRNISASTIYNHSAVFVTTKERLYVRTGHETLMYCMRVNSVKMGFFHSNT